MGGIRQCDGKVYCLKNFMVQEYQSIKYLTIAKEGSEIVLIDDLAVVVEEGDRDDELWVIDDVSWRCPLLRHVQILPAVR